MDADRLGRIDAHFARYVGTVGWPGCSRWSPGDLAACCAVWAGLPLVYQPGTEWVYSVATDVLGRVIEVVSGQPLDEFLSRHLLGLLGMADTTFGTPEAEASRLAALYSPHPETGELVRSPLGEPSSTYPVRTQLRSLVYQALVD